MQAIVLLLLAACGSDPPSLAPPAAAAPVPVRVEVATTAPLQRTDKAVGIVAALDSVEIRPETSGLVHSVAFSDGDTVRKGEVLVRLRDADAQAALADASARAKLAALALERTRPLFERGDLAKAELERVEADDALARAAVARAEEAVRRTVIVAPFDGSLGRRDVSPGQTVDPTRVLTRIEALDRLAVDVSLPESALARVHVGQPAKVEVDALGLTADASVTYVAPRVREDSRTVDVRVVVGTRDPRLRPGMTASAEIVTGSVADAVLVPAQAIVPSATGMSLWVVADGTVQLRPVVTGERTADRVEVLDGLAAGETVVVEGLARLRPGAAVTATP